MTIISIILTIIGGLNWLLVGIFNFDLVSYIFGGATTPLARLVYILVGIAAIWLLGATIVKRSRIVETEDEIVED